MTWLSICIINKFHGQNSGRWHLRQVKTMRTDDVMGKAFGIKWTRLHTIIVVIDFTIDLKELLIEYRFVNMDAL